MQPSIASSLPAFESLWPEAELVHLLDDSLAQDVGNSARGGDSASMTARFLALGRYARDGICCDGILFTCSAFGEHIEKVQLELRTPEFPVLKPNEAMMDKAAKLGQEGPVAVLSMFEPTLPSITRELQDLGGGSLQLRPRFVPRALEALQAGDEPGCIEIIAQEAEAAVTEAQSQGEELSCIAFAMFSMARGRPAAEERLKLLLGERTIPVLSSPEMAVLQMKSLLSA